MDCGLRSRDQLSLSDGLRETGEFRTDLRLESEGPKLRTPNEGVLDVLGCVELEIVLVDNDNKRLMPMPVRINAAVFPRLTGV